MTYKPASFQCEEEVQKGDFFRAHQCLRRAVLFENGKWWCKQHAPSTVRAKDAKRSEKLNRHLSRSDLQRALAVAERDVVDAAEALLDAGSSLLVDVRASSPGGSVLSTAVSTEKWSRLKECREALRRTKRALAAL